MRCRQCNAILTDTEACHKDGFGNYLDTCFACLYAELDSDSDEYDEEPYPDEGHV